MTAKKINRIEVKKYFLLANAGKGLFKEKIENNRIQDSYLELLEKFNNMEEEQLNDLFRDKTRLKRYESMEWHKCNVALKEMGSWPKMSGLPIEFTTSNIPETAKTIDQFNIKHINIPKDKLEKILNFIKKSGSIIEHLEFIEPNFPLILFPGGEIREKDYNNWARENNQPLCKIFKYDIDDGNNRAVAYSSSGFKDAPAFFGEYKS